MVSIGQSLNQLEKAHRAQEAAVECLGAAILSAAQYAVELDPELTAAHRKYLTELAASLPPTAGLPEMIECRSQFRNLLRDYRDLAARHFAKLQEELAAKAASLQQIFEVMTQGDGDHEQRLSATLKTLREMAEAPSSGALRDALQRAADTLSASLEELKRQNQLTVAQFLMEIQVLHNRIDSLQTAMAVDAVTRLSTRQEFESKLRTSYTVGAPFAVLLMRTRNLAALHRQFGDVVIEGLLAAFAKRLRNCLRPEDPAGRWADDKFAVIFEGDAAAARGKVRAIAEHCGGTYVCMVEGKAMRPVLQLDVGFIDSTSAEGMERLTQRADEFFRTS